MHKLVIFLCRVASTSLIVCVCILLCAMCLIIERVTNVLLTRQYDKKRAHRYCCFGFVLVVSIGCSALINIRESVNKIHFSSTAYQ